MSVETELATARAEITDLTARVAALEEAMGCISFEVNDGACNKSHHNRGWLMDTIPSGSPEAMSVLACFCFDLSRKFEFISQTTSAFRMSASPVVAATLQCHSKKLKDAYAKGTAKPWQEKAIVAEKLFHKMWETVESQYTVDLNAVAQKDRVNTYKTCLESPTESLFQNDVPPDA